LFLLALLLATGCRSHGVEAAYSRLEDLLDAGRIPQAMAEADRGLALARGKSDFWYWKFYLARAELVLRKDGPRAALPLFRNEPPDRAEFLNLQARLRYDRARAQLLLADYSGSRTSLAEAARLAVQSESKAQLAEIEIGQSDVLSMLGDYAGAESAVQNAGRLARELSDSSLENRARIALAFLLIQQSRFEEAIYPLEQMSPPRDQKRESLRLSAKGLINLGWCHYRLGELRLARELFEKAEAIDAKIGETGEQQICLGNIGDIYLSEFDFAGAKPYYERALRVAKEREDKFYSAKWLGNLAQISVTAKDWASAEKFNSQALEINRAIKNKDAEQYSLGLAARIAAGKGRNDEAEALYQQVIHSDAQDPAPVLDAQAGLAQLYDATDRPAKADLQFRAALALVDRSRSQLVKDEYKLTYLDSLMEFAREYVDFLMSHGRTEQALEAAEASRARILSERSGLKRSTQTSSAARYKQLTKESGAIFLSYWTAPKRSYVWLVSPNQIVAYTLPPESQIAGRVERYRSLIENLQNPLEIDDPTGRALSEDLLGPVLEKIPARARIAIVPDGSLYALNFETLPVQLPKPHYWIEDATISVVPSLNLLSAGAAGRPGGKSLLLIGNPEQADEHFPKLPYAGEEIASIRRHFEPAQTESAEGAKAVPAAYTASALGRFSYLHFTAHATANRESPLDSAIILSKQSGGYKLTARDVLKQPLNAKLVTISACRSAGAKTYAGEGLVGFTWTFFQAGAHNVIAGLWDVSDESTPRIMDRLYSGLAGGEPVDEALRAAKLALLNQNQTFRLPYYWGALQLYCRDHTQGRR
jgi:CHAT domain-containing protein/tetratricopeptide (TPR) repeat protein